MIKNWNVGHVIGELNKMYSGANDPFVTGYNNWPCKQDLYRVKFALDEMLDNTPNFSGEAEWLEEQRLEREKQQVWKAISR